MKKVIIAVMALVIAIGGMLFTLTQTGGRIEKFTRVNLVEGIATDVYRYYDQDGNFIKESTELILFGWRGARMGSSFYREKYTAVYERSVLIMKHIKVFKKEYVVIDRKEMEAVLDRIRLASVITRDYAEDITYYADKADLVNIYANRIAEVGNETIKYLTNVHNL